MSARADQPTHRPDRRPRRPAPLHRLRHRDQARSTRRTTSRPASRAPRRAGRVPVHARRPPATCTASARGRCASTPATPPPKETNERFQLPARARLDRPLDGVRPADPARPRLRRPAAAWARSAAPASRSTRSTTCGRAFDGIPLDQVSTSMTINAPAAVLLLLYQLVGEEQGVPAGAAARHDPERHPQGVRRARELHLPARAARCGSPPTCSPTASERVPKWNTISISGYHIREKGCSAVQEVALHARQRDRLRAGGHRRRARGRRVRAAARVLLQRPQQRLPGGREVPRRAPDVGADHARALRRAGRALAEAALPHADRRRDADRPAAREQHRARRAAGLRRRLRRHAVAAHERLRRGARAADRARRADRAAHAADHRATSRARPTPSTRSPAPTSSRRSPTEIEEARRR